MRRYAVLLAVIVCSAVAALAIRQRNKPSPASRTNARSQSTIVTVVDKATSQVRVAGVKVLAATGPSSMPVLLRMANRGERDPDVAATVSESILEFGTSVMVPNSVRFWVDTRFNEIFPHWEGVLGTPNLIDFEDVEGFSSVDDEKIHLADSADANKRIYAAFILGSLGPNAPAALQALIEACDDESAYFRLVAIAALARFQPVTETAPPVLIRLLSDPDWRIRTAAAHSVAHWRSKADTTPNAETHAKRQNTDH